MTHDRGEAFSSWRGIARFTALLTKPNVEAVVAVDKAHKGNTSHCTSYTRFVRV